MYTIRPIDAIATTFIKKLSYDSSQITASYQEINDLGYKAAYLTELKTGIPTLFIFWRNEIDSDLYYNRDYFEETEDKQGIRIKKGVSVEKLVNKFIGYLPLDILISFSKITKD